MRFAVVLSVILVVSALFSCTDPINSPVCRSNGPHEVAAGQTAICLISLPEEVVLPTYENGQLGLMAVKLEQPGTACKLHATVWEQSGIKRNDRHQAL